MFDCLFKKKKTKPDVAAYVREIRYRLELDARACKLAGTAPKKQPAAVSPVPEREELPDIGFSIIAPGVGDESAQDAKKAPTREAMLSEITGRYTGSAVEQLSFSRCVRRLMAEKGISSKELRRRILMDRRLFSKVIRYDDYAPSKKTALALCIGLALTHAEALVLLRTAGFALSDSVLNDIVFDYFFTNGIYDLDVCNEILAHFGLGCIGM